MPRQKDGWKDGQTLFYGTLPATVGGPIKTSSNEVCIFILMSNQFHLS